ncbi:MAG: DUF1987 domain-containing protein [Bacteroidia bacterium]|nr:DUF1987 domain-containing protein [Bacteroidia bacterium]
MEKLYIKATQETPEINFDLNNASQLISGFSIPENPVGFYQPLQRWIENYCKDPLPKIIIDINLLYFNTASAKQLVKIFLILEKLTPRHEVLINWFYKTDELSVLSAGKRFSELIALKFDFIEIKDEVPS